MRTLPHCRGNHIPCIFKSILASPSTNLHGTHVNTFAISGRIPTQIHIYQSPGHLSWSFRVVLARFSVHSYRRPFPAKILDVHLPNGILGVIATRGKIHTQLNVPFSLLYAEDPSGYLLVGPNLWAQKMTEVSSSSPNWYTD